MRDLLSLGFEMDVAKKCAEAQRKVSLRKFTEEYMTTFRAIKAADLDVNVPKDKAFYSAGSGPAGYEVVFGCYDEPENVRTARSYVNLCSNIRRGVTEVPPSHLRDLLSLGFEMDVILAKWREYMRMFRKIKEMDLNVKVPPPKMIEPIIKLI